MMRAAADPLPSPQMRIRLRLSPAGAEVAPTQALMLADDSDALEDCISAIGWALGVR